MLSWNVRGLNEVEKRLQICNLLHAWWLDIVCLQETKLEWITRGIVRSIWSCPYRLVVVGFRRCFWRYCLDVGSKGSGKGGGSSSVFFYFM